MKALCIGFELDDFLDSKKLIESNFATNSSGNRDGLFQFTQDKDLIEILTSEGPFSYVIFNLDDKRYSAPEIHEQIVDIIGLRPFIFIGSSNAIKSQLTHELINNHKTNQILETPVIPKDFQKAQAHSLAWIKNEEFEQSIQEYSKDDMRALRIKTFFMFEQLPYDVYLELTSNKYGKIISKNKFFSHQLLHSYSRKNIKYLHILKTEHIKTLDITIKNLIQIYNAKKIERSKIVKIHLRTIFFIQEYIRTLTVTEEINELARLFANSVSGFINSSVSMTELMHEIGSLNHITFAEASLMTTYLSLFIVHEMEWSADMTKERLIIASILQDIHLQNDEFIKIRSMNDPLLKDFSDEEQLRFLSHPIKASEVALLFHGQLELDFLLREHHEHPSGDGFPARLNSSNLTTLSCIFIIATYFTAKVARLEEENPNPREIVNSIKKIYKIGNFKDPVKALSSIFSVTN